MYKMQKITDVYLDIERCIFFLYNRVPEPNCFMLDFLVYMPYTTLKIEP